MPERPDEAATGQPSADAVVETGAATGETMDSDTLMEDEETEEPTRIPCCFCGKPTTWDPIYNDLCYRCCRAKDE